MKRRNTVAVITAQVESTYQKQLMKGILGEGFAHDIDVVVFSTFVKDGVWETYHLGECNIYNLIQYDKFDGIIIVPDSIRMEGKLEELVETVKKCFHGPIVSLDYPLEGVYTAQHDTNAGIGVIVSHLVNQHGISDIAFMTGTKGHPHAQARLQAFLKSMREHQLPILKNRQFYGDFWYNKGEEVVDMLVHCPEGMPEAIACGSDTMALSVYDACVKRNIRVPQDIIITGYDANEDGTDRPFFVTSVIKDSVTVGKNAMMHICNSLGIDTEEEAVSKPHLFTGKTCGCEEKNKVLDFAEAKAEIKLAERESKDFYSGYNFMMEDCIGATDLTEYLWKLDYYTRLLTDMEAFHICLCDDWRGDGKDDTSFRKSGYSNEIKWIYDKKRGRNIKNTEGFVDLNRTFEKEEILPIIWEERKKPAVFYITPLHFMDRCFGYTVLEYENRQITYDRIFRDWMRNAGNAFESMRRQMNLMDINEELEEMYHLMEMNAVTDSLTGLFNRNGFNIYAPRMLEQAVEEKQNIFVMLADVNNLKGINDTFGHTEGDFAIKTAAAAIRVNTAMPFSVDEKCFRIGGDEFAIISIGDFSKVQINKRIDDIKNYLVNFNEISGKKYEVMISIGTNLGSPVGVNIDNILQIADQKMYAEKQWHTHMYKSEVVKDL